MESAEASAPEKNHATNEGHGKMTEQDSKTDTREHGNRQSNGSSASQFLENRRRRSEIHEMTLDSLTSRKRQRNCLTSILSSSPPSSFPAASKLHNNMEQVSDSAGLVELQATLNRNGGSLQSLAASTSAAAAAAAAATAKAAAAPSPGNVSFLSANSAGAHNMCQNNGNTAVTSTHLGTSHPVLSAITGPNNTSLSVAYNVQHPPWSQQHQQHQQQHQHSQQQQQQHQHQHQHQQYLQLQAQLAQTQPFQIQGRAQDELWNTYMKHIQNQVTQAQLPTHQQQQLQHQLQIQALPDQLQLQQKQSHLVASGLRAMQQQQSEHRSITHEQLSKLQSFMAQTPVNLPTSTLEDPAHNLQQFQARVQLQAQAQLLVEARAHAQAQSYTGDHTRIDRQKESQAQAESILNQIQSQSHNLGHLRENSTPQGKTNTATAAAAAAAAAAPVRRPTSREVFENFVKKYKVVGKDGVEREKVDATGILSRECFEAWVTSRRSKPRSPEDAFRKTVISYVTVADGRSTPLSPEIEADLLRHLRKRQVWPCFEGRVHSVSGKAILIGSQGVRCAGYHEKTSAKKKKSADENK